jgi:hypothetical protein
MKGGRPNVSVDVDGLLKILTQEQRQVLPYHCEGDLITNGRALA